MLETCDDLATLGFDGFVTIQELTEKPWLPPVAQGVYSVLAPEGFSKCFTEKGTGGPFKGKNPNLPVSNLEQNWVSGSKLLYIGKAGLGKSGNRGLRKRLGEYMRFGQGKKIGHKGGRLIWQLREHSRLLVCWRITRTDPGIVESEMLLQFKNLFGALPFAKLRH